MDTPEHVITFDGRPSDQTPLVVLVEGHRDNKLGCLYVIYCDDAHELDFKGMFMMHRPSATRAALYGVNKLLKLIDESDLDVFVPVSITLSPPEAAHAIRDGKDPLARMVCKAIGQRGGTTVILAEKKCTPDIKDDGETGSVCDSAGGVDVTGVLRSKEKQHTTRKRRLRPLRPKGIGVKASE
jgi:hypothetical protein